MPSQEVERFISRYTQHTGRREAGDGNATEKIHVDEVAAKVAAFYEKIRNIIEYREAHLLRKAAIERSLRRRVFLKDFSDDFAEPLIKELIRSGHLPNDVVPEAKISEVRKIIDNLLFLLRRGDGSGVAAEWLVRMFVARIEEELFPFPEGVFLSDLMYGVIKKNLVLKNVEMTEREIALQLFVAVQKALFRPDNDQLQYAILKLTYPGWGKLSQEELEEAGENLGAIRSTIRRALKSPFAPYFLKLCNREKITFQLIGDMVFNGIPLDDHADASLKSFYKERYAKARRQVKRLAFLSVASFLISKILVAFAIEIPLDQYLYHSVSLMAMIVNIAFPPLLMLSIIIFTSLPSEKNLPIVLEAVRSIVGWDDGRRYLIKVPKRKGIFSEGLVYLAYGAVLFAILYFVTQKLSALGFSPASIVIFIIFSSMVIATGVRVNNRAKEMSLEKHKAGFFGFLVDLVTVPFMAIGRWVITGLSKFNILVVAFNLLIEFPIQLFVEFLENFRGFIKAKKEEIS